MTTVAKARREADDFAVGERFSTVRRTITETHVVVFAGITGDSYQLHMDEVAAAQTQFGTRIAHGPLVYCVAAGLVFESGMLGDSVVAFLGADNVRHTAPCFLGDTIRVEGEVARLRVTSSGDRSVMTLRYEARNQNDEAVMSAEMNYLLRGAATGGAGAA